MTLPKTPFTREQAFDLGVTQREWRAMRDEGFIRHMVGGVFVDAALDDTLELRTQAVKLILPSDVVVGRRTAAWLYGIDILDNRGFPATPTVEVVTAKRERRPQMGLIYAHVADDLTSFDVTEVDGIATTTVLRTATDITRFLRPVDGLVVLDALLNRGLLTKEELVAVTPRWRGRRGVRQLELVTWLADPDCQSGGESHMRWRVHLMGLPRPTLQIPIVDPFGRARFYLDLGWKHWRAGLEYDGEETHPPERAAHDTARRLWISERSWRLEVIRKDLLFSSGDGFERVVMRLVAAVR